MRIRRVYVLVAVVSVVSAFAQRHVEFVAVEPGLELMSGDIVMLRVTRGARSVVLTAPSDPLSSSITLGSAISTERGLGGVSGGFSRSYVPMLPAGMLVVNGRRLNRLALRDSLLDALVIMEPRGLRIRRVPGNAADSVACRRGSCLQTGPLMVEDGRIAAMRLTSRVRAASRHRAFIAVDSANRILLGWTTPRTLDSLAAQLASPRSGFAIRWAAGLSGDVNCALVLRREGVPAHWWGDSTSLIPSAFVVR